MKRNITLPVKNGELGISHETDRSLPDYLIFRVFPGCMYGVADNTAKTRTFLRRALARLEKDAAKRKK